MSKVCQITGKRPMSGNTVSHANNRKRRRFLPNLHTQRFWLESEKRWVSLKVSGNGMRTIDKKGVEVVVNESFDPHLSPQRPPVRTTEDYLRERAERGDDPLQ